MTLNCQHAYHKDALVGFLSKKIESNEYDALLLQELPEEILSLIDPHNSYSCIYNKDIHVKESRVAILLKNVYTLHEEEYSLFEKEINNEKEYFYELISLVVENKKGHMYILSSLHMPAYLHLIRRIKYLKKTIKRIKMLQKKYSPKVPFVIGGDWNSIFPYEHYILQFFVDPRFQFLFPKEYTYHTRKLEPGLFMGNFFKSIASFISMDYVLDFFLINYPVKGVVETQESDISDHNPVTLTIEETN